MLRNASPTLKLSLLLFLLLNIQTLKTCDSEGPGYFKFLSKTIDRLTVGGEVNFLGRCFHSVTVSASPEQNSVVLKAIAAKRKADCEKDCTEFILVSTGKTTRAFFFKREEESRAHIDLANMSQFERRFLAQQGLHVLRSCDSFHNFFKNLGMTAKLLIGGWGRSKFLPVIGTHIPQFQVNANIEFISQQTNHVWKMRKYNKIIKIKPEELHSGDLVFVTRFDGMDGLGEVNSGSRAGHVGMILKEKDQVFIVETKQSGLSKQGVYKLTWKTFIKENRSQDANIVLLPLKPELRKKLNLEAVWSAFRKLEGNEYGFRNYIFSQIDTENDNNVEMFDWNFFGIVLNYLEPFMGSALSSVFYEAWSNRLGSDKVLTMSDIWEQLYERNLTLAKLSAIPERDGYRYSNGVNYVCSSFVVHLFKEGGLFDGMDIQATEFTPRNVYELNFYSVGKEAVPKSCRKYSPRGYCQIIGKADFDLGKIGYVEPYAHMNEHCPTVAPNFERPAGC